jgi:hypothetical protein
MKIRPNESPNADFMPEAGGLQDFTVIQNPASPCFHSSAHTMWQIHLGPVCRLGMQAPTSWSAHKAAEVGGTAKA